MIRRYTTSPIEHLGRETPRGQLLFKATDLQEFLGYEDQWVEFTELVEIVMRSVVRTGRGEVIPLIDETDDGAITIANYQLDSIAAIHLSIIGDPTGRPGVAHMQGYVAEANCAIDEQKGLAS